jgi:hypothetical protein
MSPWKNKTVQELAEEFMEKSRDPMEALARQEEKGRLVTNSTVDDRSRRFDLGCSLCPPNRYENAKRKPRHGAKKRRKPGRSLHP